MPQSFVFGTSSLVQYLLCDKVLSPNIFGVYICRNVLLVYMMVYQEILWTKIRCFCVPGLQSVNPGPKMIANPESFDTERHNEEKTKTVLIVVLFL